MNRGQEEILLIERKILESNHNIIMLTKNIC